MQPSWTSREKSRGFPLVQSRGAWDEPEFAATQHLEQADAIYARLQDMGIRVAREGVPWHLVAQGERFDVSALALLVTAATRQGIQVMELRATEWSLAGVATVFMLAQHPDEATWLSGAMETVCVRSGLVFFADIWTNRCSPGLPPAWQQAGWNRRCDRITVATYGLTPREEVVLALLCQGLSDP